MTQHSRRIAATVVAAALALAACGAANAPLKVGVRDITTTLLLGSGGTATVQAPVPPVVVPVHNKPPITSPAPPPPAFPPAAPPPTSVLTSSSVAPVTAPPAASSSAPTDTCPAGDPLAVPKLPAPSSVQFLPVRSDYTELVTGSVTKGSRTVDLPGTARWAVESPVTDWTGSYTFTQGVEIGSTTTITTYRVVPQHNAAPAQLSGAATDPGIYLLSVQSDGTPSFRAPDPGLELASFPLLPNGTVQSSATDGTRTMSFTATVKGLETVNACGTPLAAWQLDLSAGQIVDSTIPGPDGTQKFSASYAVGTQFGGIVLASSSKVTGTDGGVPVTRTVVTAPTAQPVAGTSGPGLACAPPPAGQPPTGTPPTNPTGTLPKRDLAYRSIGVLGVGTTSRTRLPWDATWRIIAHTDGSYDVLRTTATGGSTTTYLVVPAGSASGTPPGLYLVTFDAGDRAFTAPAPGLELAAFPLRAGARLTGVHAGDDSAAISFDAVVAGPAAVGTCDGNSLDSWEIDLTGATFTDSANQTSMRFAASYFVGTQFAALILAQSAQASGTTLLPAPSSPSPAPSGSATTTPAPSSSATPSPSASGTPLVPTRIQLETSDTINAAPGG